MPCVECLVPSISPRTSDLVHTTPRASALPSTPTPPPARTHPCPCFCWAPPGADARASLERRVTEYVDKAKHARDKEAVAAADKRLAALLTPTAVDLLQDCPPGEHEGVAQRAAPRGGVVGVSRVGEAVRVC